MRTRAIQPGDLVKVSSEARVWYARMLSAGAMTGLSVKPANRAS